MLRLDLLAGTIGFPSKTLPDLPPIEALSSTASFDFSRLSAQQNQSRQSQSSISSGDSPSDYQAWLDTLFPNYTTAPLAEHHHQFWQWVWGLKRGERPRPFVGIWPRGGAKCYNGDVEILCADGTRKAIRDICTGEEILSLNEQTGRFERDVISQHWVSGIKPCLTIRTRTGKSVTLTAEHRVLTFDGWKRAGEVVVGDRMAAPRRTPVEPAEERTDEEVRLLAYMIAEGSCSSGNSKFTNADPAIVADFTVCAESMGMRVRPAGKYGFNVAGAKPWMRLMGIDGCNAKAKRVPNWVYRLPERQKWQFLAALIDTDGWVQVARGRIGIALANEALVNDLVYLWLQVGVVASVNFRPNRYGGAWELRVDQDSVARCADLLPLRLKGDKLRAAAEIPRYSLRDTYPISVTRDLPFRVNRMIRNTAGIRAGTAYALTREKMRRLIAVYPHERWVWLEQADVFWDQVVSVESAGDCETFDVEVARNHNLIGDGLVAHNSTSVELACVAVGARQSRKYVLYVCGTQQQADDHVANVAGMLESDAVARHHPALGSRAVGKYGNSRGWRRNRLRTDAGLIVDALGLDVAARGVKLDEQRPDLIVFDDVDDTSDSMETVKKKVTAITQKLLPAGSSDAATLFVQNLVHYEGVAARLANLASEPGDFLADRILSGPLPALRGAEFEKQPDGKWLIVRGTPIWEGQDLATCQQQVHDWGIKAFKAEAQHERTPPEGQAFPEWDASVHVREPFAIPEAWPKWRAVDYGYAVPYACLWAARDPAGRIYVYRETYGAGKSAKDQAYEVRALSAGERYFASVGDPAMWATQREGRVYPSVASQYAEMGVALQPATNDRLAGWERVHALLDWSEEAPPIIQVFNTCTNLIRTMPLLTKNPKKPEDVDDDPNLEDHAPDALRYLAMAAHWLESARRQAPRGYRMRGR